jgi:hypothetical protein
MASALPTESNTTYPDPEKTRQDSFPLAAYQLVKETENQKEK